ncbi:uncharacterized protein LOC126656837 [Mercurialis annua]|uniref:uncharacterized protein LOC126656837 n=1 Tax=Mercurialis annua TaxID=3986 RepID=UPI002160562B|nr:uncharacterized protein LOC126656837 [Mercurialis annua]
MEENVLISDELRTMMHSDDPMHSDLLMNDATSVEGAGSKALFRVFLNFCRQHRFDIVGILEPRISGVRADSFIKKSGFDCSHRVEANGFSGGIWVLWRHGIDINILVNNKQFIHLSVGNGADLSYLTVVYASPSPWVLGGDFNAALSDSEKKGGAILRAGKCNLFCEWFSKFHMIDLGFSGPKFLAAWVGADGFHDLVKNNWADSDSFVNSVDKFAAEARKWNYNVFGNIFKRKNILLARVRVIQRARMYYNFAKLDSLESALTKDLEDTLYQEELLWLQKSRYDWIIDGDRNSAFFHKKVKQRRRQNRILMLKDDNGVYIDDQSKLQQMAMDYYKSLFKADIVNNGTDLISGAFPSLNSDVLEKLSKSVSDEDIKQALWDMKPLKAPGPDGLHALFYQSQWGLIGGKVCSFIKSIFNGAPLPAQINQTLLTLIPKCEFPDSIKLFRPISLCNVSYKIITKIIANRLKSIMSQIIGPAQTSFIVGRHITDNIILAQEIVHSMRKKKGQKGLMAIKIDLEKAYDKLSWDFINDTLHDIGIPGYLSNVVKQCISSPSMSIIWNGNTTKSFSPSCGIRQGDPISPYLFVLCIERLAHLINHACNSNEASLDQVDVINCVLNCFCSASGQRVNKEKTKVFFSSKVSVNEGNILAASLGFSKTLDLGKYLGMPLIHGRVTKKHSINVLARLKNRLSDWNAKCLSLAGRCTLSKSVIQALPVQPKENGGLGYRCMDLFNQALIMKVGWNLLTNRDVHWVKVLKAKYKVPDGRLDVLPTRSNPSHLWRALGTVWPNVQEGTRWALCNGESVRFWLDPWLDESCILCNLVIQPIPSMEINALDSCYVSLDKQWNWNAFAYLLPESVLAKIIRVIPPDPSHGDDFMYWGCSSNGLFSTRSAYKSIAHHDWNAQDMDWKTLWSCKAVNEDILHALRDCFFAKQFWCKVVNVNKQNFFFSLPLNSWINLNLSDPDQFGDSKVRSIGKAMEHKNLLNKSYSSSFSSLISWSCPPLTWVKLNTDGAFDANSGIAKAGGLIRDANGSWLGSFCMTVGNGLVVEAELRGVYHGLLLNWHLGFRRVLLEVDNKNVVDALNKLSSAGSNFNIIAAICALLAREWEVRVTHVYREANFAADHLASLNASDDFCVVYHNSPPGSLLHWLSHDRQGVSYTRNIHM